MYILFIYLFVYLYISDPSEIIDLEAIDPHGETDDIIFTMDQIEKIERI